MRQTKQWMVTHQGQQLPLGKDEHGAGRKNPPPKIAEEWHKLDRIEGRKDLLFADVVDLYVESLQLPKTKREKKRQLGLFNKHLGSIKVSKLRVLHLSNYMNKFT